MRTACKEPVSAGALTGSIGGSNWIRDEDETGAAIYSAALDIVFCEGS